MRSLRLRPQECRRCARHCSFLAGCTLPCTPTLSFSKLSEFRRLLHLIIVERLVHSCFHWQILRTTRCFQFASQDTSNLRSSPNFSHKTFSFFDFLRFHVAQRIFNHDSLYSIALQVDGLHTFTVDVSYTNSNIDEFYYFYFDGTLAIDRSPAVCLPLGTCNVGTYTISLLISEFYSFEMQ
jgi:hypothetical protein